MPTVLDAFVKFMADTSAIDSALGPNGKIQKSAAAGGTAAGTTIGRTIGNATSKAFTAAGATGGVLFTSAVQSATSFEDQLRTINTVAGLTDEQLGAIGDQIQGLSKETGKTTEDLTAGFYDLVSAGIPAEDAIAVLRDSAILATGALGSTAESVDLVTSVLNAYGLEASESSRVTDVFAKAVADGKVTAAELGASIATIAPIAASAGVSMEEVSAGFAELTAKGVPAAQAATQMRAAISALLTPNEQLNIIQAKTGKNYQELAKTKGLSASLEELRQDFAANGDALAKLAGVAEKDFPTALKEMQGELGLTNSQVEKFTQMAGKDGMQATLNEITTATGKSDTGFAKALGSIEAYNFALATTGENAAGFQEEITAVTEASGIAQEQYEEKSKSAAEQGKRFSAQIETLMQDLGGPFVQSFGPAISAVGGLGQAFLGFGGLAKGLGGVIGGIGGKMAAGLLGLIPMVVPAATGVGSAIAAAIPIGMAALPVLLVGVLVAAVIFLANNPEIVDQIIAFGEQFVQWIVDAISHLPEAIGTVLGALPGIIADIAPKIIGLWLTITSRIAQLFFDIAQKIPGFILDMAIAIGKFILTIPGRIADLAPKVWALFQKISVRVRALVNDLVAKAVAFILTIPGKIIPLLAQVAGFFGQIGTTLMAKVRAFIGSIVSFFLGIPGRIAAIGGRIVSAIIGGMASLPGRIAGVIRNAFANLRIDIGPFHINASGVTIDLPNIQLPSFDVGAKEIPRDMIAMVHEGEMIIPAREAQAIRESGGRSFSAVDLDTPASAGRQGDVIVPVTGFLRAEGPEEVARHLDQLSKTGAIESRRQRSRVRVPESRRFGVTA